MALRPAAVVMVLGWRTSPYGVAEVVERPGAWCEQSQEGSCGTGRGRVENGEELIFVVRSDSQQQLRSSFVEYMFILFIVYTAARAQVMYTIPRW